MGQISSNDVLILISFSGESVELKNIIQFAKRNRKIILIGMVSKKNSILYKSSNIKLLIPQVTEAGPGNIVPTSSTTIQMALGDAIAISCMQFRNFDKLDFKKFHPSGSLSVKLKTVNDLMLTGKKIPFVSENTLMKIALKILSNKKLGVLIIKNKKNTEFVIFSTYLLINMIKNDSINYLVVFIFYALMFLVLKNKKRSDLLN